MSETDPTTTGSAGAPAESSNPPTPAPGAESGNESTVANPAAKRYADEAAAERKQRKELEAKLAKFEEAQKQAELAKLGDLERTQKQLAEAQERLASYEVERQQFRLMQAVGKAAAQLNLIDPDAAMLMLQAGGEVEYDSDGQPANVQKLLEKLVAAKPYLVTAQSANGQKPVVQPPSSGGATNPARGGQSGAQPPTGPSAKPADLYKQRKGLANPNIWKR